MQEVFVFRNSWYNDSMINRHFMKTLVLFTGMIVLGLLVIFVVSYLDQAGESGVGIEVKTNTPIFAN